MGVPLQEEKLRDLYIVKRHSAADIGRLLRCSEHKVNYWLLKYNITKRSISEAVYAKCNPHGDPFKIKAVKTLEDAKLLGLGLGLYWGEGNRKNKHSVRLGNTDPRLIGRFIQFLMEICGVRCGKFRFSLQIFGDMPKKKTLDFWIAELKDFRVTKEQFFKTTVTPYRGVGNYREKSKYGVLTVHVSNSKLKAAIDSMLPVLRSSDELVRAK